MAPLGLSAAIRRASEFSRRTASLALTAPRMVSPLAHHLRRPHDAILILQRGDNPSTDYYLRPRLQGETAPAVIVDIDSDPAACAVLAEAQSLMVVVCRYITGPWLSALEAAWPRIARAAFFADDDLPAVMADASLPLAVRGKVARHYGRHALRLSALCGEVWLSTPVLASRYPQAAATVLPPLPEADYRAPAADAPPVAAYHATDVHGRERLFAIEVARSLMQIAPSVVIEMTGDAALSRRCTGMANVRIVGQAPWPAYRDGLGQAPAALSLAPLTASAVNAARAPVKAFDAARMGAAGLYADAAPYRGFVRDGEDGLLLPMQPLAWAQAIAALAVDPSRRLALAASARTRFAALRREAGGFPAAPAP
jgi:hypothetical protein